ncbi:MAG: hypothetical protein A3E88_04835 [Legionellales bacterium RIFCSPHIGHO2_12_FULL_35_11]|nr:MAG: hypothetical protein A3E88_04835 [Legionellales bacterium RIFCSPHIGHO2_12_FULL_35_11]
MTDLIKQVSAILGNTAYDAHIIDNDKFKLMHQVSLNNLPGIDRTKSDGRLDQDNLINQAGRIKKKQFTFEKEYKNNMDEINSLEKKNPNDKEIFEITKKNMDELLKYTRNKHPNIAELNTKIAEIKANPEKNVFVPQSRIK